MGISWLAEDLLASQEGLCSMELIMICTYANLQIGRRPTNNWNFGEVFGFFCVVAEEILRHKLYRDDDDDALRNSCRPTGCRPNDSLSCVNNKLRKAINPIYFPDRTEYSTTCQFSTVTCFWKQWQGRKTSASSGRLIDVTLQDNHGTRLHCVTVQFVCS